MLASRDASYCTVYVCMYVCTYVCIYVCMYTYRTIYNPLCAAGCGRRGRTRLQEIEEEEGVGAETVRVTRFPPCFPDEAHHHHHHHHHHCHYHRHHHHHCAFQKLWIIGYSSPTRESALNTLIVAPGHLTMNEHVRRLGGTL